MRQTTWTLCGHGRVRAVAALVGLAVLLCALVSHSPATTSAMTSLAQAMPTMAVSSSADAVVEPELGGAAVGLPGAVMDCGGMGGSGAAHACLAAVSAPVLVALAVVLAIVVVGGSVRRGSPVSKPTGYPVAAWGAPPWTVLSRSQLSVIRV